MSNNTYKINSEDLQFVDDLAKGSINKAQFIERTDFKANLRQFRDLLYKQKYNVDAENNNLPFRNLLYYLPHQLSKREEIQLYGELLLLDWHHEHEEIITRFQVLYKNYSESVGILVQAFKNVPNYIYRIPELSQTYRRKIVYALVAQKSCFLEALNQILPESRDEVVIELIRNKLSSAS